MSPFVLVYALPMLVALVPLAFGIAWLVTPGARSGIEARYPLRTVTWLIAAPAALACAAALVFGVSLVVDGSTWQGTSSGSSGVDVTELVLPMLGLAGLGCAIAVLVFAHRRRPRFAMMAVAAAPILVVLWAAVRTLVPGDVLWGGVLVLFALGSTANALFAATRPAPASSPDATPAPAPDATAASSPDATPASSTDSTPPPPSK